MKEDHVKRMSEWEARTEAKRVNEEQATRDFEARLMANEEARWDNAELVVLAGIQKIRPSGDHHVEVRYAVKRLLKGKGGPTSLRYKAWEGPMTTCGGYDAGLSGGVKPDFTSSS